MDKRSIVLVFILLKTLVVNGAEINFDSCDENWTPYKDEHCVKLFKTFLTRTQAQDQCRQESSSLVTIKSADEQLFLNEYVFNSSDSNSVWIGAERSPNSETNFVWVDGTAVQRFTNWRIGSPSNIIGRSCVQMQTKYSRQLSDLEWVDVSCNGASWFICQKLQIWSIGDLQRAILATRQEMQTSVEKLAILISDIANQIIDMRSDIVNLRNEISSEISTVRTEIGSEVASVRNEMNNNVTALRNELRIETTNVRSEMIIETTSVRSEMISNVTALRNELRTETTSVRSEMRTETTNVRSEMTTMRNSINSQLQTLQSNPVPLGFIYVQLSGQSEPRQIWSTVSWTEVTSQYAGLFFRAQGGGSAGFGSVQQESSPRITRVDTNWVIGTPNFRVTLPSDSFLTIGRWSSLDSWNTNWALQFTQSTGEVRPRNSAIRIWRRNS